MPNPREELPDVLKYIPDWRKGDPGPDWTWVIHVLPEMKPEARARLVVSQLQYEKEVAQAQINAIDRNINAITSGKPA